MMDNRQVLSSTFHASDRRSPSKDEMHAVFEMCRKNQWTSVLNCVRSNPSIAVTTMTMDNHISTTILHQAITSKGDTKARARVMLDILSIAPHAASIKNGYGSLPLHVIAQRNTKMDAPTKELLITELVLAYKDALVAEGGVGKRTPLHIIFTGKSSSIAQFVGCAKGANLHPLSHSFITSAASLFWCVCLTTTIIEQITFPQE